MNRTTLRYFVTVVRLGSIRQAAEQLNVAQSAISRQIMRLEEDFGVLLLDRLPRGVQLLSRLRVLSLQRRNLVLELFFAL